MREALGRQALKHNGRAVRAEAVTDAQVLAKSDTCQEAVTCLSSHVPDQ